MLHNLGFKAGYFLTRPGVIPNYRDFQETQWLPFEQLKDRQEQKLTRLIKLAYENIPYYSKLLNTLGLTPSDVTTIEDLEKIPVLTKQTIRENWQDFIPKNINKLRYLNSQTSGSTGKPFKYRISTDDYERGMSLLYRGWGYAGYKLGDKVALIGGSPSIPTPQSRLRKMFRNLLLNFRDYSSITISPESLQRYFNFVNRWRPSFIRGYASSIHMFARFIRDNNMELRFQPKAIFTTSDMLFSGQRKVIEEVFNARVFDQYGLFDGGISAQECEEHHGMHIDMERAILETVDEEGKQIVSRPGKILATSLYNYALPFIRYDTGDEGMISHLKCTCGRKMALLKGFLGRTNDALKLRGVIVSDPGYGDMLGNFDIEQFQIIQEGSNSITFRIIKGKTYKKEDEKSIEKHMGDLLRKQVGKVNIKFDYVNSIPITKAGKYKFIINKSDQV